MTSSECPVTIAELKAQLRMPADLEDFDSQLETALMVAAEWCEDHAGVRLADFPTDEFPWMLRGAILLYAASYFDNPTDRVSERITAAQRLADPLLWQTKATTSDTSTIPSSSSDPSGR